MFGLAHVITSSIFMIGYNNTRLRNVEWNYKLSICAGLYGIVESYAFMAQLYNYLKACDRLAEITN